MSSVADLVNWFNNLPYEAKLYWCGRDTLDYSNLPWRRFHEYFNKLSRTYLTYKEACAFSPGLSWDEYVRSRTTSFGFFTCVTRFIEATNNKPTALQKNTRMAGLEVRRC